MCFAEELFSAVFVRPSHPVFGRGCAWVCHDLSCNLISTKVGSGSGRKKKEGMQRTQFVPGSASMFGRTFIGLFQGASKRRRKSRQGFAVT